MPVAVSPKFYKMTDYDAVPAEAVPTEARVCTDAEATLARRLRFSIGRLSRQLRSETAALSPSQVSVLFSVRKLGPSRMIDLAIFEAVAPPTLTPIVASLVSLGHLTRKTNPDDARSSLVELTASGEEMLERLLVERTRLVFRKIEALTPAARANLEQAVCVLEELAEEPLRSAARY